VRLVAYFTWKKTIPEQISQRYGLTLEDATNWHTNVKITASYNVGEAALQSAVNSLYQAKILKANDYAIHNLVDSHWPSYKKISNT